MSMAAAASPPDLPAIDLLTHEAIDRWGDLLGKTPIIDKLATYTAAATELYAAALRETDFAVFRSIEDSIEVLGSEYADLPPETVDKIMTEALVRAKVESMTPAGFNGSRGDEPPPAIGPEDYGVAIRSDAPPAPFVLPPLSIENWLSRDLPAPDRLLGDWLSTTSRILINGPTGLGKTNYGMAIAGYCAAGRNFLHWRCHKPARVLYVDGEMSRRLLKRRIEDLVRRLGTMPERLFVFSHEDIEGFQPLNTPAGAAMLNRLIEHVGGVDLVIFDNVMSLIGGDMKEEEGWQRTLPLVADLTKRNIGQIWFHHTGHDDSRGYGTKTREWRMDTVQHLSAVERADTDVSFRLEFRKARERTPETRRDFEDVSIALVNDEWVSSAAEERQRSASPLGMKFLEALQTAVATGEAVPFQSWTAIRIEGWREECFTLSLLDRVKPDSARTLFNKHKRELIACNLIGCHEQLVWLR